MMDEWNEWMTDEDTAALLAEMQKVLSDPRSRSADKMEALSMLANMGEDEAIALLRWYCDHATPSMALSARLALIEAERYVQGPRYPTWYDDVLMHVQAVGEELLLHGAPVARQEYTTMLAAVLRQEGLHVEANARAILKYNGLAIEIVPLAMVVNNGLLIGFWTAEDDAALVDATLTAAAEVVEEGIDEDEDSEITPLDRFYTTLRAANLPFGLQINLCGDTIVTDYVENSDVDRGMPKVEYILAVN